MVGLPLRWDGQISIQGQKVKDFAAQLAKLVPAEIVFWDERLTTVEAERLMIANKTRRKKKKQKVDKDLLVRKEALEQLKGKIAITKKAIKVSETAKKVKEAKVE